MTNLHSILDEAEAGILAFTRFPMKQGWKLWSNSLQEMLSMEMDQEYLGPSQEFGGTC